MAADHLLGSELGPRPRAYELLDCVYTDFRSVNADIIAPSAAMYSPSFQTISAVDSAEKNQRANSVTCKEKLADTNTASQPCVVDLASLSRDWYQELRQILDRLSTSPVEHRERQVSLSLLSRDFADACAPIAKMIVDELHLPESQRSIKPANVGGAAGGTKFKVGNVLFKFAVDNPEEPLYGNDPAQAGKAAKAEQRGLQAVVSSGITHLGFPLQCLIDFGDLRITAMCILPINSDTLMYGSNDRGVTVHDDNHHVSSLMRKLAKTLNLAAHQVSGKTLHLAGDVEGHLGTDKHAFILDTARMWPPESASNDISGVLFSPGAVPVDVRLAATDALNDAYELLTASVGMQHKCERVTDLARSGVQAVQGGWPGLLALRLAQGSTVCRCGTELPARANEHNPQAKQCLGIQHCEFQGAFILVSVPPEGAHLTQLLRPNAVNAHPRPLSADAFTGWGGHAAQIHNQEVESATNNVLHRFVPRLAAQLIADASGGLLRVVGQQGESDHLMEPTATSVTDVSQSRVGGTEHLWDHAVVSGSRLQADPGGYMSSLRLKQLASGNIAPPSLPYGSVQPSLPMSCPLKLVPHETTPSSVLFQSLCTASLSPNPSLDWKQHLHAYGCNTRHLGQLAACIRSLVCEHEELIQTLPAASKQAIDALESSTLAYAVARVCKVHLWRLFRRAFEKSHGTNRVLFVQDFFNTWMPVGTTECGTPLDELLPQAITAKYPGMLSAKQWACPKLIGGLWSNMPVKWQLHCIGQLSRLLGAQIEVQSFGTVRGDRLSLHVCSLKPRVSLLLGLVGTDTTSSNAKQFFAASLQRQAADYAKEVVRRLADPLRNGWCLAKAQFQLAHVLTLHAGKAGMGSPATVLCIVHAALRGLQVAARDGFSACIQQYCKEGLVLIPGTCSDIQLGHQVLSAAKALATDTRSRGKSFDEENFNRALQLYEQGVSAAQDWVEASSKWICSELSNVTTCSDEYMFSLYSAIADMSEKFERAAEVFRDAWQCFIRQATADACMTETPGSEGQPSRFGLAAWIASKLSSKAALHASFFSLQAAIALQRSKTHHGRLMAASEMMAACSGIHAQIVKVRRKLVDDSEELQDTVNKLKQDSSRALQTGILGCGPCLPSGDPLWFPFAGVHTNMETELQYENDDLQEARWTEFTFLRGQPDDPVCIILDGFPKHSGRGNVGDGIESGKDSCGALPSLRSVDMMICKAELELGLGRPQNCNMASLQAIRRLKNVQSISFSDDLPLWLNAKAALAMSKSLLAQYIPPALEPTHPCCLLLQAHTKEDIVTGLQATWGISGASIVHAMLCASSAGGLASGAMHAASPSTLLLAGIHPKTQELPDAVGQLKTGKASGGYFSAEGAAEGFSRAKQALYGAKACLGAEHPACAEFFENAAEAALKCCEWELSVDFACRALALQLQLGPSSLPSECKRCCSSSSACACLAACAFHQGLHQLGSVLCLVSLCLATGGDVGVQCRDILKLLLASPGRPATWCLPKSEQSLPLEVFGSDLLCIYRKSILATAAAASQLEIVCISRAIMLLLCHSGVEDTWSNVQDGTLVLSCLCENAVENVPVLHVLVHAGILYIARCLGLDPVGSTLCPADAVSLVSHWLSEDCLKGQALQALDGDDWDAVGFTWIVWFIFRCGWFELSAYLAQKCQTRLRLVLPVGRSGESPHSALVQAAVIKGCEVVESSSKTCNEHMEQLLFLGVDRLSCARALLCTASHEPQQMVPCRIDTLKYELHQGNVSLDSSACVMQDVFSMDAATEWLLDPSGRSNMQQDLHQQNLSVWLDALGSSLPTVKSEVLSGKHVVCTDMKSLEGSLASSQGGGSATEQESQSCTVVNAPSRDVYMLEQLSARDAIQSLLRELYPTQKSSIEFTALTKMWQGGDDPLDFVGVYQHPGDLASSIPPHWHYVSFGLSDLYGDRRAHSKQAPVPGRSGFGMEFTMRVAREPTDTAMPPQFPAEVMNTLARYMHASGTLIQPNEYVQYGSQGNSARAAAAELAVKDEVRTQSSRDSTRSGLLLFASKPHCIGARDTQCPELVCSSGRVSFVQLVPITDRELSAGRMWNMDGLRRILQMSTEGAVTSSAGSAWDSLRDASGAFSPGPLLVADARRYISNLDVSDDARALLADGVRQDGSAAAEVSGCLCWLPQLGELPAAQACLLADTGTCLSGVDIFCNESTFEQLAGALAGRLPRGRAFMVNTLHTVVQQANDSKVAALQAQQHLNGWGCSQQRLSLMTEGAGCAPIPQVAHPGTPFAVAAQGHVQVFLSRKQALRITQTIDYIRFDGQHVPLPLKLSWPTEVPGLVLWVVGKEPAVWSRVHQHAISKADMG